MMMKEKEHIKLCHNCWKWDDECNCGNFITCDEYLDMEEDEDPMW